MNRYGLKAVLMGMVFLLCSAAAFAGPALDQSGKGIKIWFDTGGPVGEPYNTIV